ncbi:monocarboxylate transporter 9 [Drosophila tropicalis]|uniref:monocarboxylate transporter 9 n=1 Tax=Drosophila tropicalis TaxID=46794 RepID=UPI0035AB6B5D
MTTKQPRKVAPDGGWGWVACFGVSLVNLATRSIEPSFGLLFGDTLKELNVGTTGAAIIISALDVCMNFSGLFVGPLLKEFSYRKVAIAGSMLCGLGLALTSPATSMAHILSTYSVINGIGVGLSTSAAFVALNHYFKHKRGQAVGLSMAGTAMGMLIMPQLVRVLLEAYNFSGAVLLLAGVALNATVGSVLLQPVKWHMKEEFDDEELMCISALPTPQPQLTVGGAPASLAPEFKVIKEDGTTTAATAEEDALPEMNTLLFHKHSMRKNYSEMAMNTMNGSRLGLPKRPTFPRIMSLAGVQSAAHGAGVHGDGYPSQAEINATQLRCRKASVTSNLSYMDFTGSILQVHLNTGDDEFEQNDRELRRVGTATGSIVLGGHRDSFIKMKPTTTELDKQEEDNSKQKKAKKQGFWRRFADLLDIAMLKDKMFLNLLFGLSIFYVAEMNFKMVTPFFFANLGYKKADVAFCLSITAITDIAARIVLPPIFDRTTIKKRTVFLVSIIFVAITRSIMAEQTDWTQLMIWLSICGFFRGSALSNFTLTVSEYCSLEKLPSAFGWHLVGKALFVISFGPLIGLIRDVTDSYPICIHTQSICILMCAFAWGIEYLVEYIQSRRRTADAAQVPTQDATSATATAAQQNVKL